MKKILSIVIAIVVLITMTSCKKEIIITIVDNDKIIETITTTKGKEVTLPNYSDVLTEHDSNFKKKDNRNIYTLIRTITYFNQSGYIDDTNATYNFTIKPTKSIKLNVVKETEIEQLKLTFTITNGILPDEFLDSQITNVFSFPEPDVDIYDFNGWYTNEVLSGLKYSYLENTSVLTGEYNYYGGCEYTFNYLVNKYNETISTLNELIPSIPSKIALQDQELIDNLYQLYISLPAAYQNKVTNKDILIDANSYLDILKQVSTVNKYIDQIIKAQDFTVEMYDNLLYIKTIIEDLKEEDHQLITKYDELLVVEPALVSFYNERRQEAKILENKINLIPSNCPYNYIDEIESLYTEYLNAHDETKLIIKNVSKLYALYQDVKNIKNNNIIYVIKTEETKNLYTSKNALRDAFFTDFYYFILTIDGGVKLKENNIHSSKDFLNLAKDEYGGNDKAFRGIGNIAGEYLLKKDLNGSFDNQPVDKFLGFCYQNKLYTEFLPFYYNAFAFWRIGEKYANLNNYGADLFAEAWAPTVDLAKFFHYNERTSYVKTNEMVDALTNVATVTYGFDASSLPELTLRGYTFEGWYDNEEFTGEKLTSIDGVSKVYANFVKDSTKQDEDLGKLITNYIYNLSTKLANVNTETVNYVREMYNNASDYAKSCVTNYQTLCDIEEVLTNE